MAMAERERTLDDPIDNEAVRALCSAVVVRALRDINDLRSQDIEDRHRLGDLGKHARERYRAATSAAGWIFNDYMPRTGQFTLDQCCGSLDISVDVVREGAQRVIAESGLRLA